jgi:membrane peptidoglycan carboxypeptidase
MTEKLQKGGPKPPGRDQTPAGERFRHFPTWWKKRHAAKKRRLAAMSRRRRIARRFALAGTWILGLLALFMVATVALFYTLSDVPRPESLPLPQSASILYADGSVMTSLGDQNRTLVSLDKVPESVRWAVVAAEDRGFYKDPGFSVTGTLRAALSDLTGGDTQGGSGITQQYVKNAYLNDSRTLSRKLKELMISVKLSRQYSKDQILEFYLNRVYFGRGAYGIQAAAHSFFNTDVSKLSVAQGAVLAALLRAPSTYDPTDNPTAAKARWQYVLDGMVSIGKLTKQQEATIKYPTVVKSKQGSAAPIAWKYFIQQQVLAELKARGITPDDVTNRGLRIVTTIQRPAQDAAVSAVDQTFANLTQKQRNTKNALVAVDPKTGAVLAYYGGPNGKGYDGKADYNDYAGVGSRPAGSSFKPFTLATALTQTVANTPGKAHVTISSYVDGSQCVTIQGKQICNDPSDKPYSSSSIKLADALKYSLNTTFDQLAVTVGPDNVSKTAWAAGVKKTDSNGKKTLVNADGHTGFGIGIGDYAVRPIDQAVGFATFANGGSQNPAYFVQQATDSNGHVVYKHKAASAKAVDPKVANDVTLAMEPIAGWSGVALDGGRTSAAKTGTEGIQQGPNNGGNSDAWMVGFTPQVSAAVWVGSGNSTNAIYDANGNAEYGRDLPGRTWKLFMDTYLAGKPNLPMATTQQVTGGQSLAKSPIPTPTHTTPTPSKTPTPSFSRSTGFTTPTPPVTSAPTTPTSTPPTSPSPPPTCGGGILQPSCPPASPTNQPGPPNAP